MAGNLQHYFAWANYGDTFDPSVHNREDLQIFEIEVSCTEANLPMCTLTIQNPGIGLLNPSYANGMRWGFVSYLNPDSGMAEPIFFGRLVSVPLDLFGLLFKIQLRCEPPDFLAQKQALALGLMQLPYWDPVFLEIGRRLDPETVLEGYASVWFTDPVTAQVSTSNVAVGEGGTIVFTQGDIFWNSVKATVDRPPSRSIYFDCDIKWTQYDVGYINLDTPTYTGFGGAELIQGWPKLGTSLGPGYQTWFGFAYDAYGVAIAPTHEAHWEWKNADKKHNTGDTMSVKIDIVQPIFPYGAYSVVYIQYNIAAVIFAANPFDPAADAAFPGYSQLVSQPEAVSYTSHLNIPYWYVPTVLTTYYEAKRERTENVRATLAAAIQPVYTDPGGVAANFALDSEYMNLHGNVGLEIPFGNFVGEWQPLTFYPRFSIIQTTYNGEVLCFQVFQDIWSLDVFDPAVVGSAWIVGQAYVPGQIVINPITYETFEVQQPVIATTPFVPFAELGVDFRVIFKPLTDPHQGAPIYKELDHYRGNWATSTVYVAGDIIFAPDGRTLKVAIGHTSTTYALFNTDPTGRLLYQLLVNPPAIGFLGARWYLPTARGQQSLQNIILRGRSRLLTKGRVFKTEVACSWEFATSNGLRLNMNAQIFDGRLPGGMVVGKITSYKYVFKNGTRQCQVIVQSIPGEAPAITESEGSPTYGDPTYMGPDYQEYTGTVTLLPVGDVAYSPPAPDPNGDDGLTFPLTAQQAVYSQSYILNTDNVITAIEQAYATFTLQNAYTIPHATPAQQYLDLLQASMNALAQTEDTYELVLNPIQNGPFSIEYDMALSVLGLPKQVDLSAAPIVPVYQGP